VKQLKVLIVFVNSIVISIVIVVYNKWFSFKKHSFSMVTRGNFHGSKCVIYEPKAYITTLHLSDTTIYSKELPPPIYLSLIWIMDTNMFHKLLLIYFVCNYEFSMYVMAQINFNITKNKIMLEVESRSFQTFWNLKRYIPYFMSILAV